MMPKPNGLQSSFGFFCNICIVDGCGPESLSRHYRGLRHKSTSELLCRAFLNRLPEKTLICVEDVFYHPNRKGTLIGLQYLESCYLKARAKYKCLLCEYLEEGFSIYSHLVGLEHKKKYISRAFPFLLKQIPTPSDEHVENIAAAIEAVEGITKLGTGLPSAKQASESSFWQNVDRLLEKLAENGMHFESPNRNIDTVQCLKTELRPSSPLQEKQLKQLKGISTNDVRKQVSEGPYICNICNVYSKGSLHQHFLGEKHKVRLELLCLSFLNHLPEKSIMCVEDVFNDPKRKGTLIGLQYLHIRKSPLSLLGITYICTMCGYLAVTRSIYDHLVSLKHKEKYITQAFPFLFEQIPKQSSELVEKIAEAVEAVEGITKFVHWEVQFQQPSNSSSRQDIDRLLEKLAESGMHFEHPYRNKETVQCLETALRLPTPLQETQLKQLNEISTTAACNQVSELPLFCNICNVYCSCPVSIYQHYLGVRHKMRSELLCLSFLNHLPEKSIMCVEDVFNDPKRMGTLVGLQYLQIYKRPLLGSTYKCTLCGYFAVTRSIYDHLVSLKHKEKYITQAFPFLIQQIPKPSNELIEKFAVAVEAVEGIAKFVTDCHGAQQPSESSSEQIVDRLLEKLGESGMHFQGPVRNIKGISTIVTNNRVSARPSQSPKHSQRSLYSFSPVSSSIVSPSCHFSLGYQICTEDSSLPVTHAAEPPSTGNIFQDLGHSTYSVGGRGQRQESMPSDAKDLQTMGTMSHSSSKITSPSLQFSTRHGSGLDSSCYDGSSMSSESTFPSGIAPLLHKESTHPRSNGGTLLSQVYPAYTISPSVQSSQGAYSSANIERIFNGLSPDTLKILQGKDIVTVKSILKNVSDYYPPLKQVNIPILVDILFETGALDLGGEGYKTI